MVRASIRGAKVAAAALAITLGLSGMARADVYLSLGDSVGFGIGGATPVPSDGTNQGYVPLYASYLAAGNGGVKPTVVNLAVPGETSTSFSSGAGRVGPDNMPPTLAEDALLASLNTNYTTYAASHGGMLPTQQTLLAQALTTYGTSISHVTISLGSDDLFNLVLTNPNPAAGLGATLTTFATNTTILLTELRAALPMATIVLVSSYDPYPAGTPGMIPALAGPAIAALDNVIFGLATQFHVSFANVAPAFSGNELTLTNIASNGNVHPTAAGYLVIAGAIEAVPEPSTFALTCVGVAGLLAGCRGRSRRASAG